MASFIGDDLTIEIERHLKTAVEVCIAAAFVNFQGVELLRGYIEKTLSGRSYKINFLLDKDFHPHPAAREAIIKELCTIPGATVKVFDDAMRRLHMKVYIFSGEDSVSVIAGSHNPTGAGLTKNIEAGLLTSDVEAVRKAQEYFNEYWGEATIATPDPTAYYKEPLFYAGQGIRHRVTGQQGAILGTPNPVLREKTWYYHVMMMDGGNATIREFPEDELRAMVILEAENEEVLTHHFSNPSEDENEYLREVLRRKLIMPVKDGLFSYMASRTEVVPYQFKPLLKILSSDSYRILIADEVGLGKTIEAGIIFTELKARFSKMKRALVICPTNLKTKWKEELESRFDEYFKLLNREEFERVVCDPELECFGIVSYELLGHDETIELLKERESNWDFLILDEAHHLRNKNKRNRAVSQITKFATAIVMLSATPINLSAKDLTHLLQILLPRDYRDVDDVEFLHRLEPNRYLFEAVALVGQEPKKALEQLEKMELDCKYADRVSSQLGYQQVKVLLENKESLSLEEVARVTEELTNLNTFANIITRTRKEDVGAGTTREVITYEVEFTDVERQLYQDITGLARMMAGGGNNKLKGKKGTSLAVMMPQRQAASCLPAAIEYVRDITHTRNLSADEVAGEIESEDGHDEIANVPIKNEAVLKEANRILEHYARHTGIKDTKYEKLKEFLRTRAMNHGRLDKVILFTSFRRTLTYLQAMLEKDFGKGSTVEIHGDIQPLTERDSRRRRFQDPGGPSILLCTEVGSEGLDMQFANKLVNYDLPWNPMRIEQRIGRIDRHGQKAEKLLVLNFAISDTIEDNVVTRLIERVKVFRDSLGELNQVVGEVVNGLRDDLLNPTLTDKQRREKIEKYERSIEVKARAEERLRGRSKQLIGQDNSFVEELRGIHQNRRYVTPEELRRLVELFCMQYPEQARLTEESDLIYKLTLEGEARDSLRQQVQSMQKLNDEKRERYLQKFQKGEFLFTFDRETAMENKQLDFFVLQHPVVAGIVTGLPFKNKVVVGHFEGESGELEGGIYLLYTYYCDYERNHLPPSIYLYNIAVHVGSGLVVSGDKLYHQIVSEQLKQKGARTDIDQAVIYRAREAVTNELTHLVNGTVCQLQKESELLISQQIEAIQTTVEREIGILSTRSKLMLDNRERDRSNEEIKRMKRELEQKLNELRNGPGDVIAKPMLVGVACCEIV